MLNQLQQLQHLHAVLEEKIATLQQQYADNLALLEFHQTESDSETLLKVELEQTQAKLNHAIDRESTLEEQFKELTLRHDTLVLTHETLRTDFERFTGDLSKIKIEREHLIQERDQLLQKNKLAKSKVESIMSRLAHLDEHAMTPPAV